VLPAGRMPCSRTPVVLSALALTRRKLLPSLTGEWVGFTTFRMVAIPMDHNVVIFRGSMTRPASSLHPASYPPSLMTHAGSLLSCWLGFAQVGFGTNLYPQGNYDEFQSYAFPSSRAFLARHRHYPVSPVLRASPPPDLAQPGSHELLVGATGTPPCRVSRVATEPLRKACRHHYPGGLCGCSLRSLPHSPQPSL
jgi:hypothetical protein